MLNTSINMAPLSIIFFGTDHLAEPILRHLLNDTRLHVQAVVTQPDRPVGRKQIPQASPVKELALAHNLPVMQPAKLRDTSPETLGFKPDFFVVTEFGQIIPQAWLDWPTIDVINVHPSRLPQYRGPTPIQTAIWNGDTTTAVTIMQMEATVDSGAIVAAIETDIGPDEIYAEVEAKLAALGGPLLCDSLVKLADKTLVPVPQNDGEATYCRKLTRDSGRIDWKLPARTLYNQFRALTPWPGIWTTWNGQRLKLLAISLSSESIAPGQVSVQAKKIIVGTVAGAIEIKRLQLEGRSAMDAAVFVSGAPSFNGAQLE